MPLTRKLQRGFGNADRPIVADLWRRDSRPLNVAMQTSGNHDPAYPRVDFRRYYDPDFAKLELEKLWSKSWLFACRDEDIPEVGDRVPVEVGPLSFFVVRGPNGFKAFRNSCLHRGTKLCTAPSSGASIRCPYHAWEWRIDGSLKYIPSHWDFKSTVARDTSLREVKLGRWGGFIFINADPDAAPLEEALSVIPDHFKGYDIENRYTAGRFRKLVRANWKICQEAFQESYHVIGTHPQAIPYNGDSQAQYDIWASKNGHVGRQATPSSVPSMHADESATALQAAEVYAIVARDWHYPDAQLPVLDPKRDPRAQIAEWHRSVQRQYYGSALDLPDAVMIDSLLYFMFPSFSVWLSETLPFVYQFTPHATDPEMSYFEVRFLRRYRPGEARPASAPVINIGPDESIAKLAPGFGALAAIFDQDMDNVPNVQLGARAADPSRNYATLGDYQESIIQHWHQVIDECLKK
jgi:phenylpropionate dioxygenase-like ring-hydroxylating dioxygenase large terminal subunit